MEPACGVRRTLGHVAARATWPGREQTGAPCKCRSLGERERERERERESASLFPWEYISLGLEKTRSLFK